MSIFGKIGSALKKAAPIVATVAQFIPATAPFAAAYNVAQAARKKNLLGVVTAAAGFGGAGGVLGKIGSAASKVSRLTGAAGIITASSQRGIGTSAMPPVQRRTIQIPRMGQGPGAMNMSILGGLGTLAGKVAGRSLPGIGATAVSAGRGVISAGRGLIQRYPRSAKLLRDLGLFAVGGLVYDAAGNLVGQRAPARRINPMNVKAMRRSIRRVKAGRKICAEIDRMLPKRRAAAACAPAFTRTRRARKC